MAVLCCACFEHETTESTYDEEAQIHYYRQTFTNTNVQMVQRYKAGMLIDNSSEVLVLELKDNQGNDLTFQVDTAVTTELENMFPSGPDKKWVGFSSDNIALSQFGFVEKRLAITNVSSPSSFTERGDAFDGDWVTNGFVSTFPIGVSYNIPTLPQWAISVLVASLILFAIITRSSFR